MLPILVRGEGHRGHQKAAILEGGERPFEGLPAHSVEDDIKVVEADDVGPGSLQPREKTRQATIDVVDVERGDPERSRHRLRLSRRLTLGALGRTSCESAEPVRQPIEPPRRGEVGRSVPGRLLIVQHRDGRSRVHGGDASIEAEFLGLSGETAARQERLQGRAVAQQAGGRLRPNAARARELVGGITPQRDEVRHLLRIDAVALAHLGGSDARHLAGSNGMQDRREPGRQLERVAVAARHDRSPPARLLLRDRRGQEIVGLVSSLARVHEPAGGHELRQQAELVEQFVIEDPAALVGREQPAPEVRRVERVPADQDRSRTFLLVEPDQRIGEAEQRAAALVAASADRLREAVIGAMREGIAVHDQER